MALTKSARRNRIHKRIRSTVKGTQERPRLSVFRSNKEIYVQLINDVSGVTLAAASSRDKDLKDSTGTKIEIAQKVGLLLASRATKAKIDTVTFDRGGYLYHGRVKALADGAREGGIKF